MPPSSPEQDIKRRARRRLIGAVALTLLAVIVLPLLLESEPPPASSLAVKMAVVPPAAAPEPPAAARDAAAGAANHAPEPARPAAPVSELPATAGKPAGARSGEARTAGAKPETPRTVAAPPVRPSAATDGPQQPGRVFVVQLAALSDATKAEALKTRAGKAGLPAYVDAVGALTRVRVGPYPSREAAVAAAVRLAENGMAGQVVLQ